MSINQLKPLIPYGWLRALLQLIFFFIVIFLVGTLAEKISIKLSLKVKEEADVLARTTLNSSLYINTSINFIATFLSVWIFRKMIDRQSIYSLGFSWRKFYSHAWTGFFTAIAILGLGTLFLVSMKYIHFTYIIFNIYSLTVSICLMIMVALSEELLLRGYLLNNLMKSMNKYAALFLSALLFAIMHMSNPGTNDSILPLIEIFIGGILLGINYIYTQNLWFGIFMHFAWNFFQGPIFGYKISGITFPSILQQDVNGPNVWTGGSFGFEGSLLAIILNITAIVCFVILYEKKHTHT